MIIHRHDGTPDGWAGALRAAAAEEGDGVLAGPGASVGGAGLFDTVIEASVRPGEAARLFREWSALGSDAFVRTLWHARAWPAAEPWLAAYARLGLRMGAEVDAYHAHPAVHAVHRAARRVRGELHRLRGLLRFRDLGDGRLWGPFESDADLLWPLAAHFVRRQPADDWVLHDVGRARALWWNGRRLTPVAPPAPAAPAPDEVAALWRAFFRAVAVPGRENPDAQRRNMPRRYWAWLTELDA
jgi:probable DNA metabolism protein